MEGYTRIWQVVRHAVGGGYVTLARILDTEAVEWAVLGGGVLGGGGGGSLEAGRQMGRLAVQAGAADGPTLVSPNELDPEAMVGVVGAVGAPAGGGVHATPEQYGRAVTLLQEKSGLKLAALAANECGALATVNGWLQSALLGIPVLDAPCNGRAHPTAVMGSLGLHRDPSYISRQAAVGGAKAAGNSFELYVTGSIEVTASMVRQASAVVGGLVAVARNPVTVIFQKKNGAPGAISQCLALGRLMTGALGGMMVARVAADFLGGTVAVAGVVGKVSLRTSSGFDAGTLTVGDLGLTFWNEFMTLETKGGRRLATFPDLIALIDLTTGEPLTTAAVRQGQEVAVLAVPKEKLSLGAGMRDPALLLPAEKIVGKEMVRYAFGIAKKENLTWN